MLPKPIGPARMLPCLTSCVRSWPLSRHTDGDGVGPSARALFPLLPEQVQHLPELASLPPLSSLDPEQEQRRLFAALADVFTRAAASPPVPLVVEDLHWCDESTLEFLLFFARKTVASPVLYASDLSR